MNFMDARKKRKLTVEALDRFRRQRFRRRMSPSGSRRKERRMSSSFSALSKNAGNAILFAELARYIDLVFESFGALGCGMLPQNPTD